MHLAIPFETCIATQLNLGFSSLLFFISLNLSVSLSISLISTGALSLPPQNSSIRKNGRSYQESEHDHPNCTAETVSPALENQEPLAPLTVLLRFRRIRQPQVPDPLRLARRLRGTGALPLRHPHAVPQLPGLRLLFKPGGRGVRLPNYRRSGSPLRTRFLRRNPPLPRRRRGEVLRAKPRRFPQHCLRRGPGPIVL